MSSGSETGFIAQETEVPSKPRRRRFTAEYKRKILEEVAACTKPGEIGALLRREGLYSSSLGEWRRAQESEVTVMVAPEPYLSAYLAVVRGAILETRALAWGNGRLRSRLSRRGSELMADLQDAIHVIVELIPEWERCDEPALRRGFLQAFDDKWGRRGEKDGSLVALLDRHLGPAKPQASAEPPGEAG